VPGYAHADRQVALAQRTWMAALPRRIVLALPDGRRLAVLHGDVTKGSSADNHSMVLRQVPDLSR
jgi:UDP-2,3-diacylglucosamine pyrophosphatase LpxH